MFFSPATPSNSRRSPLQGISFFFGVVGVLCWVAGCVSYTPRPLDPEKSAARLESRSLDQPELRDFLIKNGHPAPAPGQPWDLELIALAGTYFNPTLAVARAQFAAMTAAKKSAGARLNPTLGPSLGYDQNPGAGISPWFPGINFDWPIETAGKRSARIAKAEFAAESLRQNLFDTAWTVRRNIRAAYLDVLAAEARAEVVERIDEANNRIVELINDRLKFGMISVPEASTARLNRQRAHFDAGESRRVARAARLRLAEAVGLPGSVLEQLPLQRPSEIDEVTSNAIAAARSAALRSRPDILAALADYQTSEAALRWEVAKQYPDFHFTPGYLWDLGERKWSIGLTFELPIFNHNEGPIAEAEAAREERAARFLATQAKVMAELDSAQSNYAQALAQLSRARGVRSAADEQQHALQAERDAGEADALQGQSGLLENLNAHLLEQDAESAVFSAEAAWEDTVRQPLPQFSGFENRPVTSP